MKLFNNFWDRSCTFSACNKSTGWLGRLALNWTAVNEGNKRSRTIVQRSTAFAKYSAWLIWPKHNAHVLGELFQPPGFTCMILLMVEMLTFLDLRWLTYSNRKFGFVVLPNKLVCAPVGTKRRHDHSTRVKILSFKFSGRLLTPLFVHLCLQLSQELLNIISSVYATGRILLLQSASPQNNMQRTHHQTGLLLRSAPPLGGDIS